MATTLSIAILSIATLSLMTLSIEVFSIIDCGHASGEINPIMPSVVRLTVTRPSVAAPTLPAIGSEPF